MRTITKQTNNKFLNIYEVKEPECGVNRYQYAERLGVDSVAFICHDVASGKFLLNKEYKPPVGKFVLGAFGGSIDSDKNLVDIVIGETREEAGFEVKPDDVFEVGSSLVSTQMNQYCHLFVVMVDKTKQLERKPENAVEALATTKWVFWSDDEIAYLEDWKPITIVSMGQRIGIISTFLRR